MFSNVNWPITIALFLVWALFLFLAPTTVVHIVALGIAGWQVGNWIYMLGTKND